MRHLRNGSALHMDRQSSSAKLDPTKNASIQRHLINSHADLQGALKEATYYIVRLGYKDKAEKKIIFEASLCRSMTLVLIPMTPPVPVCKPHDVFVWWNRCIPVYTTRAARGLQNSHPLAALPALQVYTATFALHCS